MSIVNSKKILTFVILIVLTRTLTLKLSKILSATHYSTSSSGYCSCKYFHYIFKLWSPCSDALTGSFHGNKSYQKISLRRNWP